MLDDLSHSTICLSVIDCFLQHKEASYFDIIQIILFDFVVYRFRVLSRKIIVYTDVWLL